MSKLLVLNEKFEQAGDIALGEKFEGINQQLYSTKGHRVDMTNILNS